MSKLMKSMKQYKQMKMIFSLIELREEIVCWLKKYYEYSFEQFEVQFGKVYENEEDRMKHK